jgi:hypothetical protein
MGAAERAEGRGQRAEGRGQRAEGRKRETAGCVENEQVTSRLGVNQKQRLFV